MRKQTRRQWLQALAGSAAGLTFLGCERRDDPPDAADVCIVGSGPAGAVLAYSLASRGIRTLLLEGGPDLSLNRPIIPDEVLDLAPSTRIEYPTETTRFLGDGGTSNLWAGACPRFQPRDFETSNSYVPQDAAWPITYGDLEAFYDRAETELTVVGGPESPYAPPRGRPLASRLEPSQPPLCLGDLLEVAGYTLDTTPESASPQMVVSHLPRLEDLESATFERGVRVTEIVTDGAGSVAYLTARDSENLTRRISASVYVLACGGIETPRLLLHSRSDEFPRGIGNAGDCVGRYFMEHLSVDLGSFVLPTAVACPADEEAVSWQFSNEFKDLGLGNTIFEYFLGSSTSTLGISAVMEMRPSPSNRVFLSGRYSDSTGAPYAEVNVSLSQDDLRTWEHARVVAGRVAASVGATLVRPAEARFRWAHHHMGTCRMGRDPLSSVVDPNLRVHGVENLYVSGSAPFVTCGAGSPTLLLTALTLRLADHLAQTVLRSS